MNLTGDERRALAFIAALLFLSAAVRLAGLPEDAPSPAGAGAGFDLEAHIAATERAVAEAERAALPLGAGERLDANTAPATELERLPGIGRAVAERIVEERERGGSYGSVQDLTRVRGIGEATVAKLAEHVVVSGGGPGRSSVSVRGRVTRAGTRTPARPGAEARVDINRADAAGFTGLPGIGPVLAARIVAHRDSAGPFEDVQALLEVKGIGPATLARIEGRLSVGGRR